MTAIDKYIRLEAVGQWKETPDDAGQEIIVSFGDATLVLSDFQETPTSHWALAGMRRLSLEGTKAVYSPDTQGFETLEIDDAAMVEAISQVSRLTQTQTPKKRRGYGLWVAFIFLLFGIAAIAPIAIRYQARAMTSPESARYIGYQMIDSTGIDQCSNSEGNAARDLLVERVFDGDTHRLIISNEVQGSLVYPGGLIILGISELQGFLSPDDLSNWLINNSNIVDTTLNAMFRQAPLMSMVNYISSGELRSEIIDDMAIGIALNNNAMPLENAGIQTDTPIIRDQDWQALRRICLD